jgi:hypothetical protein
MESKITIELDFDKNNLPIIQVIRKTSDDVRDGIVGNFIQHLDHGSISRWLKIEYKYKRSDGADVWHILPISSSLKELESESRLMKAVVDSLSNVPGIEEDPLPATLSPSHQ